MSKDAGISIQRLSRYERGYARLSDEELTRYEAAVSCSSDSPTHRGRGGRAQRAILGRSLKETSAETGIPIGRLSEFERGLSQLKPQELARYDAAVSGKLPAANSVCREVRS